MTNRRNFLTKTLTSVSLAAIWSACKNSPAARSYGSPVIVSTWDNGIKSNAAGWPILQAGGRALDAVEAAAKAIEDLKDCCVGLQAYPDRDGKVTLDASIMDEKMNCGSVAFLSRIKHPISVARKVMETTPHVLLAGDGALQFALANGFNLESETLSDTAQSKWQEWLQKSQYKPVVNIENTKPTPSVNPPTPAYLEKGKPNHDTMGVIALDSRSNLSGACTTSGMAFKVHGRVGDSPIIGAGLYVDNEVGAATSSGVGEEVIRICGTHLVIELMRQGKSPEEACKLACERIVKNHAQKTEDFQVGFLALNRKGEVGAYAIQKDFSYVISHRDDPHGTIYKSKSIYR